MTMDHATALALLHRCRDAGLDAWHGQVTTDHGRRYVVCCRPAPGHPTLWLTSPEDAARRLPELVRSPDDARARNPVRAAPGAPDRPDRHEGGGQT